MAEIRMYHPDLKGDEGQLVATTEAQAKVYEQSGWKRSPKSDQKEGKS